MGIRYLKSYMLLFLMVILAWISVVSKKEENTVAYPGDLSTLLAVYADDCYLEAVVMIDRLLP